MPFSQLIQSDAPGAPRERYRISSRREGEVIKLFNKGFGAKDISEALGLSLTSVYGSLRNLNVKPPHKSDNMLYEFSDLYRHIESGGTIPSFAKSKGLTKSSVDYWIRKKYGTASISNFMRKRNER